MDIPTTCTNTSCYSKAICVMGYKKDERIKFARYVYFDTKGENKCSNFIKKRYNY